VIIAVVIGVWVLVVLGLVVVARLAQIATQLNDLREMVHWLNRSSSDQQLERIARGVESSSGSLGALRQRLAPSQWEADRRNW
jgi:hypothetical protein